jgi:hypothetical protein
MRIRFTWPPARPTLLPASEAIQFGSARPWDTSNVLLLRLNGAQEVFKLGAEEPADPAL